MGPEFLLKGIVIGFSIAAPVGPIGVLCIRRTLAGGFVPGITTGLGAATADAVYGAIAAFGLSAVTSFLVGLQTALGLIGGAFLVVLGCRSFFSRPVPADERTSTASGAGRTGLPAAGPAAHADTPAGIDRARIAGGGYLSTFFLTITNPMTILFFVAVFAGAGLASARSGYGPALLLVAGVFTGSALWWLALSAATGFLRTMITSRVMRAVNYLAGVVIAGFGLYAFWSVL